MILAALLSALVGLVLSLGFLQAVKLQVRRIDTLLLQAGDVDSNGDIVDELRDRLDGAIGPDAGELEHGEHLDLVLADVLRLRRQAGGA